MGTSGLIEVNYRDYEKAIDLLKSVLLQGDEKDELQLSIEDFLIKTGEISSPRRIYKGMTKKEFKEMCGCHRFTASGRILNAIYFDWKSEKTENGFIVGYKYMVKAYTRECSKAELLNQLYLWVTTDNWTTPYYLDIRFAETDKERFKVPVCMSI